MQDGEGFDDANQNLNGYWKLGKLEGPSYKIAFFQDFLELLNHVFFGGGPILFGVLPTFFASVSSFLQVWVFYNLKRFCIKVWYILHLAMGYLQWTIIPIIFIDPMDLMVCWILWPRAKTTERREFLKSFSRFFHESTDSYWYLFLETGWTHSVYLLTDKLERFPDRFEKLTSWRVDMWGPAFFFFQNYQFSKNPFATHHGRRFEEELRATIR